MNEELPLADANPWKVVPRDKRITVKGKRVSVLSRYELQHDGKCHHKGQPTEGDRVYLERLALFLNRQNIAPRAAIQCLADAQSPKRHLRERTPHSDSTPELNFDP